MSESAKELVPSTNDLLLPTLEALRTRGGSATNREIAEQVTTDLQIPTEVAEVSHLGSRTQTELEYRLAWARTKLKRAGLVDNPRQALWTLTPQGRSGTDLTLDDIQSLAKRSSQSSGPEPDDDAGGDIRGVDAWKDELLAALLDLDPSAFERLCQRLLREKGFEDVIVTGRTGDGGVDGMGHVQLAGLLRFPIAFQCKRYQGSVGSDNIRDFRGAMDGRAERGLVITTGRFTAEAHKEAERPGAKPVDLVDGAELVELLAERGLAVRTTYVVDDEWLADI